MSTRRQGKPCRHCGGTERFTSNSNCVKCSGTRTALYYRTCPAKRRAVNLKYQYGVSVEDYAALLAQQGSVCAICQQACSLNEHLSVDHDHETGRVRGLLCHGCNTGLGRFKDSLTLVKQAVAYLEKA